MTNSEIVKARLRDKDCYHCKWCRAYNNTWFTATETTLEDSQKLLLKARKETFKGRNHICIGAGRDTFSLDKNLTCEKYRKE